MPRSRKKRQHPPQVSVLQVARPAAGGMVTHLRLLCDGLARSGVSVEVAAPAGIDPASLGGVTAEPYEPIMLVGPCDGDSGDIAIGNIEDWARENGYSDVDEFIADLNTPAPEVKTDRKLRVIAADIRSSSHPLHDLNAARRVASIVWLDRHDIIHGHGLRGAWIAALAARFARKPFVFTAHNLAPLNAGFLSRFALRYVLRRSARVICISHAVADSLTPYGLITKKVTLIPNGIDLTAFELTSPRSNESAYQVVAVGRLSPEKGFVTLVDAAADVLTRFPNARFTIAGDGPERESLAAQVARLGLDEVLSLPGRVEDSAALLLGADIVVVPSLEEGQGIVALEAMAARKPVVASSVGGLVETVEDGITGVLVPPGSPQALASALIHLLSERDAWEVMGAAGRARVEAEYTADRMVERTVAVYRDVVPRLTP